MLSGNQVGLHLQDNAAGLLKAVDLKVLQVSAAIGHNKDDKQLVLPKHVHGVVLRAVTLVPCVPLLD